MVFFDRPHRDLLMPRRRLLYYITDRTAFSSEEPTRRRRLLATIERAVRAGVDYIQVREKDLPARELEALAREIAAMVARLRAEKPEWKTKLLINSRVDVAIAVEADGVHLRSGDLSPREVKAIWALCGAGACFGTLEAGPVRQPLVGVSCHSAAEVDEAAAGGATFAVFAPVFEKRGWQPAGLARLREASQGRIPVLALGGITLANARSSLEAGAAGIAGIRLFQENDIEPTVQALRRISAE
jgi:thiamine-phosphate pyrophosphorylase